MGDLERDIRARLEIERTGDPGVLKETAEDVEALAPAAEKAEEGLDKLEAAFERVAKARGIEEQRQAVEDLGRTFLEVGAKAAEGLDQSSAEARELQEAIQHVEDRLASFGGTVEESLQRADAAWLALQTELVTGGEQADASLITLRASIDDVAAAMARVEASGGSIHEAHRAQLDHLTAAYRRTTEELEQHAQAQAAARQEIEKTTEATTQQERPIRSLEDLLQRSPGRWASYALAVGSVIATFKTFYSVGTDLRDLLNDLSDGGFDRGVQKWAGFDAIAGKLVGTVDEVTAATGRLQNNLHLLAANGIDPAGKSVLEIDRLVEDLGRTMQQQRNEAAQSTAEHKTWAEALNLSKAALDAEAAALVRNISRFADANKSTLSLRDVKAVLGDEVQKLLDLYARLGQDPPAVVQQLANLWDLAGDAHRRWAEGLGISKTALDAETASLVKNISTFADANKEFLSLGDLKEVFGEQVQGILDQYELLGQQPPAALRQLAALWSLLPFHANEARKAQALIIEKIQKDLTGVAKATAEELAATLKALPEAIEGIDFAQLRIVDPEQFARSRELVQGWVNDYRQAGQDIPLEVAKASNALGVYIGMGEVAGAQATVIAGGQSTVATAIREVATAAGEGSTRFTNLGKAQKDAGEGTGILITKSGEASTALGTLATAQDRSRQAAIEFLTGQQRAAESTGEVGQAAADAAIPTADLATAQGDQAAATERAGTAAGTAAPKVAEVAKAAGEQGEKAGEAAKETKGLADETDRLGEEKATSGIKQLKTDFELVQGAVRILTDLAAGIPKAFQTAGAGASGWEAPIVAGLKNIQTEAGLAYNALQRVAGADDAGPAPIPSGAPPS